MSTTVTFAELTGTARERAIEWMQQCQSEDWQPELGWYATLLAHLGFDVAARSYQTVGGMTRCEPDISYSLGYSQSDYACFKARWHADRLDLAKLQAETSDATLFALGARLQALALAWPTAWADCEGNERTVVSAFDDGTGTDDTDWVDAMIEAGFESTLDEILHDLDGWLYDALRADYEGETDEAYCVELLTEGDWRFDEEGHVQ